MFEGLTASLSNALGSLGRSGKLTEANIKEGLRAVREALLEADGNYEVADNFIQRIAAHAVGE